MVSRVGINRATNGEVGRTTKPRTLLRVGCLLTRGVEKSGCMTNRSPSSSDDAHLFSSIYPVNRDEVFTVQRTEGYGCSKVCLQLSCEVTSGALVTISIVTCSRSCGLQAARTPFRLEYLSHQLPLVLNSTVYHTATAKYYRKSYTEYTYY